MDETGLTGEFSFRLRFPRRPMFPPGSDSAPAIGGEPLDVTFFSALEKQLGLKLVKSRAVLPIVAIDRVA